MSLSNRIREEKLTYQITIDSIITESTEIKQSMGFGELTGTIIDFRAYDVQNTKDPITSIAGHNEGRFKISHPKMSSLKGLPIIYTSGSSNGDRYNLKICNPYPHEKSLNAKRVPDADKQFARKLSNLLADLLPNIIYLQYEGGYMRIPDSYAKRVLMMEFDICVGMGLLDLLFPETDPVKISNNLKCTNDESMINMIRNARDGDMEFNIMGQVPYALVLDKVNPIYGTTKKLYVKDITYDSTPTIYGVVFDENNTKLHYILTHPDNILSM